MLTFCTLFDSRYLSRGMAMYWSLCRYCEDFHLYIFAFDQLSYSFFIERNFPRITVISLGEFEDEALLAVKESRTHGEYCWTCTSSTILYVLNTFSVDSCTYIDADLFFFSSPQVLLDEVGDNSILLTEHRYTVEYDQSVTSGIYCVQFMFFKNDKRGITALKWWRDRCLEWCYNRQEDGKFGDQKYLDDWTERFEGVHVLQHLGGGVAPWNMQQYNFERISGKIYGIECLSEKRFELIFFHFHDLLFISPHYFSLSTYKKNENSVYKYLLHEYTQSLLKTRMEYPLISTYEQYFSLRQRILHLLRIVRNNKIIRELYSIRYSS